MQQIYTDPSPPPLLPSFWSGARSFFLFPALHHLLHRLLQIPLPSLFSPQCFHLDTYPCSKRDHDFSPHQAFQQHLTSSQFVQEPPDSKEQSSFQTASISWISCTHTLQEIPYQTAQLLPGCAQVTVELKSWVHSAPLLLLPVAGRFTVVELTSLQLPGQGLKAIHYSHWVLTKCQERSSKLIWERARLCRFWDNEWDLSEADIFLTTLSSWNCILDKIQTYHGNTSIFRKWHCKRNIELKHFSEIKTFEWGKLAS